ncbi:MAG: hypothetical protein KGK08_01490 [Acidobacteriota bacterium]|nr:hypothetical protein [Acidobacteriota bacterium]
MELHRRTLRRSLAALALAALAPLATSVALAQQPPGVQDALSTLSSQTATHTGFVFDRDMLQQAQQVLVQGGLESARATAALHSIAVDTYRYSSPAFYAPEALESLNRSYHAAGWKHLVNVNQTGGNTAQPRGMVTDLWLHYVGGDIDGVTVLARSSRDMSVIQVACDLRPLDLVHLSGHFGIPRVDPNAVMVPAPDGR